jgi:acyl phosphate:glycerol-3-phosphate acyltransferase
MTAFYAVLSVFAAYLIGGVNFALIFTKILTGKDIRTMGNKNPGASNMGRIVGRGWGIFVMILDGLKAIIPILLVRLYLFNEGNALDYGVLYAMGIAAVLGHIFPIWYHFKGGGGVATMLFVSLWFVPLEFLLSMLIGGLLALLFMRNKGLWMTQWAPIFFVTLTPFLNLAATLAFDIPVWKNISFGGHPWTVVAGCFVLSLMMMGLNMRLLVAKVKNKHWEKHEKV